MPRLDRLRSAAMPAAGLKTMTWQSVEQLGDGLAAASFDRGGLILIGRFLR